MKNSPQISPVAWTRLGTPSVAPLLLAVAAYAISVLVAHDHAQTWTWAVLVLPVALGDADPDASTVGAIRRCNPDARVLRRRRALRWCVLSAVDHRSSSARLSLLSAISMR